MADQNAVSFKLAVAADELGPLLADHDALIDKMAAKLQNFVMGGGSASFAPAGIGGTAPASNPAGSAAGVAAGSVVTPNVPPAAPYAPAGGGYGGGAGGGYGGGGHATPGSFGGGAGNVPPPPASPNVPPPPSPLAPPAPATGWTPQQRAIAFGTAGYLGLRDATAGIQLYANQTASGDYDPMAGAALWGGTLGATGGAIVGALASPLEPGTGAAVGALAGQSLGSAALQAIVAPFIRQRNSELILQSIAARESVDVHTLSGSSSAAIPLIPRRGKYGEPDFSVTSRHTEGLLDHLQEEISFGGKDFSQRLAIKAGIYAGKDIISLQQISQTYASLGSGLLAAGDDPEGALGMTEHLARKFYMGAPAMASRAARVAAIRNQQGGNRADMLLNVGPEDYGAWTDATSGELPLMDSQRAAFGSLQRDEYHARRAADMVRGSGAAQEAAYGSAAKDIALLPGGRSSLAYAEANASRRAARAERYGQEDLPFNLRMAAFENDQARAAYLPYSPAFIPRRAVEMIETLDRQIGVESARYNHDMAAGDMTEADQLRRFRQIEGLRTDRARDIGTLAKGGEDRMLALSSNRPEFFARMDSERLAQTMLFRTGNGWNRMHGAKNGQQLAMQQSWLKEAGGDDMEHTLAPFSRTGHINSSLNTSKMEDLLSAILMELKGGKSVGAIGGTRPSESRSNRVSMLDTQSFDADALYGRAG